MQKWYIDYQRSSNNLQALASNIMGTRCSLSAVLKDIVDEKFPLPNQLVQRTKCAAIMEIIIF